MFTEKTPVPAEGESIVNQNSRLCMPAMPPSQSLLAPRVGDTIANAQRLVPFDGEFTARQLLNEPVNPAGRQIMFHAADGMVKPPRVRVPITPTQVDNMIDTADRI